MSKMFENPWDLNKWSPDQPRDASGRFGEGDGGEGERGDGGEAGATGANGTAREKKFSGIVHRSDRLVERSRRDYEAARSAKDRTEHREAMARLRDAAEEARKIQESAMRAGHDVRTENSERKGEVMRLTNHTLDNQLQIDRWLQEVRYQKGDTGKRDLWPNDMNKWNPDQERDEQGRFSGGGGSGEVDTASRGAGGGREARAPLSVDAAERSAGKAERHARSAEQSLASMRQAVKANDRNGAAAMMQAISVARDSALREKDTLADAVRAASAEAKVPLRVAYQRAERALYAADAAETSARNILPPPRYT